MGKPENKRVEEDDRDLLLKPNYKGLDKKQKGNYSYKKDNIERSIFKTDEDERIVKNKENLVETVWNAKTKRKRGKTNIPTTDEIRQNRNR